jgi:hypothetical protein
MSLGALSFTNVHPYVYATFGFHSKLKYPLSKSFEIINSSGAIKGSPSFILDFQILPFWSYAPPFAEKCNFSGISSITKVPI